MSKVYIGIDPGKDGFICAAIGDSYTFNPIPKVGKEVDIHKLSSMLYELALINPEQIHCVLEDVHAMFGSSAKGTFNFGYVCGIIEGIICTLEIPYTKVQPKTWQKEMWQGIPLQKKPSTTGKTQVTNTKLMSELAAKRLFPNIDLRATERSTKNHDGKIDALLMCEYCKRKFK